MKSRVNLAVRTGTRGRETGRETGARVRHVPVDGTGARTRALLFLFHKFYSISFCLARRALLAESRFATSLPFVPVP